jgi:hypothetical protein
VRAPLWENLTWAVAGTLLTLSARPLDDPDTWWHVRAGDSVLDGHGIPRHESWTFTSAGRPWLPTSWAADAAMALAHRLAGWEGLRVLVLLVAAAFATLLIRHLREETTPEGAALTFALVAVVCSGYLRERPQAAALCLAVWLAWRGARLREGLGVNLLGIAGVTWLWAQVHGSWPLVPVVLLVSAVLGQQAKRGLLAAGVAVLAAALTPLGPALLLAPFRVAERAQDIAEWRAVRPLSWQALEILVLVALVVVGVARGLDGHEALFALAALAGSLSAVRLVAPAVVLASPVLAAAAGRALPRTGATTPRALPVALALTGAVGAAALIITTAPIARSVPVSLVTALSPGSRVLVDYNVGGLVAGLARTSKPAVDGRTEVFDPAFLASYLAMTRARGDWHAVLDRLDADEAIVRSRGELAPRLVALGWRVVARQGTWALLKAPT